MDIEKKVVWSEGLFLQPQHFQQQERYLESYIHRAQPPALFAWGFSELTLDVTELALNRLAIRSASGIFPDGTPFQVCAENLPNPITLPTKATAYGVYLGIPKRNKSALEFSVADSATAMRRYGVQQEQIGDSVSDASHQIEMQTAHLKPVLLTDSDPLMDYSVLGVAKVADVVSDNHLMLDETYIPPMLHCGASILLQGFMKEIHALLLRRSETLIERQAGSAASSDELIDYLSLMLINRTQPILKHFLSVNAVHPELLYRTLIALAAELSTLHADERGQGREFAPYQHDDLDNTFTPLMVKLRQLLSHFIVPRAELLALTYDKPAYVTDIHDPTIYSGTFVLALHASVPMEELRSMFESWAKVASIETIGDLVNRSVKALPLTHLSVVPKEIPHYQNYLYFRIEKIPEYWPNPEISRGFAVYLPDTLPDLKMNMWVIRRPIV